MTVYTRVGRRHHVPTLLLIPLMPFLVLYVLVLLFWYLTVWSFRALCYVGLLLEGVGTRRGAR